MKSNVSRPPSWYAWQRFRRNRPAFSGFLFIILCCIIAIAGYLIIPDSTPDANRQTLELETRPPGFKISMLRLRRNVAVEKRNILQVLLYGQEASYTEIPLTKYTFSGDSLLLYPYTGSASSEPDVYQLPDILFPLSMSSPDIARQGDQVAFTLLNGQRQRMSLKAMQAQVVKENIFKKTYWLGTDRFGRDMLSRMLLGARISLAVGFISVFISLFIGVVLGALAGFFGGWIDGLIRWLVNVVWSIPTFLLVMAIALILGRGFWQVFLAVGLTMWVDVARMVRGQILSARELEYVQAARALGYRNMRIIFLHILPNITGPVMVLAAANFASAILLEAGLSFLGLGVQPPTPSWGVMINDHYGYIVVDAAYLAILPGVAIALLVLSFNMLGNGLRDALDVRMK